MPGFKKNNPGCHTNDCCGGLSSPCCAGITMPSTLTLNFPTTGQSFPLTFFAAASNWLGKDAWIGCGPLSTGGYTNCFTGAFSGTSPKPYRFALYCLSGSWRLNEDSPECAPGTAAPFSAAIGAPCAPGNETSATPFDDATLGTATATTTQLPSAGLTCTPIHLPFASGAFIITP